MQRQVGKSANYHIARMLFFTFRFSTSSIPFDRAKLNIPIYHFLNIIIWISTLVHILYYL